MKSISEMFLLWLSRPQGQIIDVKMRKIAINLPFLIYFQPLLNIIEFVRELDRKSVSSVNLAGCQWKATRGLLDRLSENWSLVTCITNLGMIHKKLPKYRAHK